MDDQQTNDPQDDIQEPTDEQLKHANDDLDLGDPDDNKHKQTAPPSVLGEEDIFSGDMPQSGEGYDIDEELGKVGLAGDQDGMKPLGVSSELQDEEK